MRRHTVSYYLDARQRERKKQEETNKKIAKCEVGAVMNGTVETLKDYGAFVELENGLTGLLHYLPDQHKADQTSGCGAERGTERKSKDHLHREQQDQSVHERADRGGSGERKLRTPTDIRKKVRQAQVLRISLKGLKL